MPANATENVLKMSTCTGDPLATINTGQTVRRAGGAVAGVCRVSFERGDKDARAAGAKVGDNAWAKAVTYFNGTATPPHRHITSPGRLP
jgi:hypothetical protein